MSSWIFAKKSKKKCPECGRYMQVKREWQVGWIKYYRCPFDLRVIRIREK